MRECPYYYTRVMCGECKTQQDCDDWPYRKAPEMKEDVTLLDMHAHVRRVELLCNLVTAMMLALIDTPIGMMLPPDIVQQVKGLKVE